MRLKPLIDADFEEIYKTGKKLYSDNLIFIFAPSDESKVSIVVSKKHGTAVVRNRIKRVIKACLCKVLQDKAINFMKFKLVILPKQSDQLIESKKIINQLQYFCEKINIAC